MQDNLSDNCDADGGMNDTKLGNKSVTFAAHTTIYEKKVRGRVNAYLNIFFYFRTCLSGLSELHLCSRDEPDRGQPERDAGGHHGQRGPPRGLPARRARRHRAADPGPDGTDETLRWRPGELVHCL